MTPSEQPAAMGAADTADAADAADAAGAASVADAAMLEDIVVRGPGGAFAVVGVATTVVVAIWFVFYFFVYLPRGTLQ